MGAEMLPKILKKIHILPICPISQNIWDRVSNEMGQCNFSGQRDRSSIVVPGQRDKLKILPRDGTGRDFDKLSRPGTSRDNLYSILCGSPNLETIAFVLQ